MVQRDNPREPFNNIFQLNNVWSGLYFFIHVDSPGAGLWDFASWLASLKSAGNPTSPIKLIYAGLSPTFTAATTSYTELRWFCRSRHPGSGRLDWPEPAH